MAILSATRGKSISGLPNWTRSLGVAQAPDPARSGRRRRARAAVWMRADFEGLHQLLEALALVAAEKICGRNVETVEADLEFLHAAIAEHLDLAARHAGAGKGFVVACRAAFRRETSTGPCSRVSAGLVRASRVIRSARAGWVIQVLLPVMR